MFIKSIQNINSRILVFVVISYMTMFSHISANPLDLITTTNNNKVFFCSVYAHNPDELKPVKVFDKNAKPQGMVIDYCDKVLIGVKHYSSEDQDLVNLCPSGSIYRLVNDIKGPANEDGVCNSADIEWYCDTLEMVPAQLKTTQQLPKDNYYCPEELYDTSMYILRCPYSPIFKTEKKLRSGGYNTSSTYCDLVKIGEKHYVEEDQVYAEYDQAQITKMQNIGYPEAKELVVCPSESAYRIIASKDPIDSNGNCHVTYDVYCDQEDFTITPFDSQICPKAPKEIVTEVEYLDSQSDTTVSDSYESNTQSNYEYEGSGQGGGCCNNPCGMIMGTCGFSGCQQNCDGGCGSASNFNSNFNSSSKSNVSQKSSYSSSANRNSTSTGTSRTSKYSERVIEQDGIRYIWDPYSELYIPLED